MSWSDKGTEVENIIAKTAFITKKFLKSIDYPETKPNLNDPGWEIYIQIMQITPNTILQCKKL